MESTVQNTEIVVPQKCNWKSIVGRVGTSFALLGTIIALIFVFLIGYNPYNAAFLSQVGSIPGVNVTEGVSIYDYFSKIYDNIAKATESLGTDLLAGYSFVEPSLYIPAVICTVVAAGTLVSVVALGIIAIINLLSKLMGNQPKHAERYAIASILTYIAGTALLRTFNNAVIKATYSMISQEEYTIKTINLLVGLDYNGATVAGIVIGAICLGLYLACHIATKGAELKDCNVIMSTILTAVSMAFVGIVVNYASYAAFTMSLSQSEGLIDVSMPTSILLQICANDIGITYDMWHTDYFLLMCTMLLQVAVIGVAVAALIVQIIKVIAHKTGMSLAMSIALLAVSLAYFSFAVATAIDAVSTSEEEVVSSINAQLRYVPSIITLIFALLNFGVTVTNKIWRTAQSQPQIQAEAVSE